MKCRAKMPGNMVVAMFYYMFKRRSLRRGEMDEVIYDVEGAREGQYGCT